jgi:hypothetical protein
LGNMDPRGTLKPGFPALCFPGPYPALPRGFMDGWSHRIFLFHDRANPVPK